MPGVEPVPLGVYDHAPDPDFTFIKSVGVGRGGVARFSKRLTSLVNELNDLLPSIPEVLIPGP